MAKYRVSPLAKSDLDSIWGYIARDSQRNASRFLDKLELRFGMLARQPLIGEACDDLVPGLRSFPVGNYVIFYKPTPDRGWSVEIVRVLHGARDIERLF